MVAVVSTPAHGQLAQIAGAHQQTAFFIGQIKENLGALSGLGVLISNVMHRRVVTNIRHVLHAGVCNGDLLPGDPQRFHKIQRIAIGAIRGAKPGHGHTQHGAGRFTQQLHSAHSHQQRQGGVQTATDPQHAALGAYMLQPPGQAAGLEQEDLLAPLSALGVRCRHKGVRIHNAVRQIILCIGHRARLYRRAGPVLKGHILPPLGIQLLNIHIGNGEHAFSDKPLPLCQNTAVLRH